VIRQTTVEMAHQHPSGAVGVLDVERLGIWVKFSAVIEEVDSAHGPQPVVTSLAAQDDDGKAVDVGKSEHASVVMLFLQAYYRWRRRSSRGT